MRAGPFVMQSKRWILHLALVGAAVTAACSSSSDGGNNGATNPPGTTGPGGTEDGGPEPPPERAEFGLDARPSNATCKAPARPPAAGAVKLEPVFTNVQVTQPMWMAQPPGDKSRWIVAQRDGKFFSFASDNPANVPTQVADVHALSGKTIHETFEAGFLGFAFHPKFAQNGRIYVSFSTDNDANTGFASEVGYITSQDNGATFTSYTRVFNFDRAKLEHNGGGILFGPDGYLYLSFGDQALDGELGQVKTGFSAKIIRIDVDNPSGGKNYGIPPTNPYANGEQGFEPATYAYGFRNPFRISIDRETGQVWTGDVGQDDWEEVDEIQPGGNYGWPCREGNHDVYPNTPKCPSTNGIIAPVVEHQHTPKNSRATIGGVVYRGKAMPAFHGTYVYGDIIQLEAWALSTDPVTGQVNDRVFNTEGPKAGFTAFVEDNDGEIFALATFQNTFYKVVPNDPTPQASTFPDRLSKTGCVDPANPAKPAEGVIPFAVNAPLWSDGAEKERFIAIPDGTQIAVKEDGDFDFPIGTVLMKHFSLNGKKVETRLFIRHDDGEWGGYSYEWLDDGTDAVLLPGGKSKPVGAQTWTYPARSDCMRCHTSAAGRSLGPELGQLNGDGVYPTTNRLANQLKTLDHIGLFSAPLAKPVDQLPAYPAPFGDAPVDQRARAYMHSNCGGCHRPQGGAPRSDMDFRFATSMADTHACNVTPQIDDFGIAGAKLLAPGAPDKSIVSIRVHATDVKRMPPLGRSLVDDKGVGLIDQFITQLTCP